MTPFPHFPSNTTLIARRADQQTKPIRTLTRSRRATSKMYMPLSRWHCQCPHCLLSTCSCAVQQACRLLPATGKTIQRHPHCPHADHPAANRGGADTTSNRLTGPTVGFLCPTYAGCRGPVRLTHEQARAPRIPHTHDCSAHVVIGAHLTRFVFLCFQTFFVCSSRSPFV